MQPSGDRGVAVGAEPGSTARSRPSGRDDTTAQRSDTPPQVSSTIRGSRWPDGAWTDCLIVGTVAALLYVPLLVTGLGSGTVMGFNDFPSHLERAEIFQLWPFSPPLPHFLTHLLIRAGTLGGLLSTELSTTLLTLSSRAALGAAVYLIARGVFRDGAPALGRATSIAVALAAVVIESPRVLLAGTEMRPGASFLPLQYPMGPTGVFVLPLVVIAPPLLLVLVRRAGAGTLRWTFTATVVVVLVLGGMAKPSLILPIAPVLPFWAYWWAKRAGASPRAVLSPVVLYVVPACVLTAMWQVWWLRYGMLGVEDRTGVRWAPLLAARASGFTPVGLLAVIVPVTGLLAAGRRFLVHPTVVLLSGAAVVGLSHFLLLAESGHRWADGNTGKGFQLCVYLLSIEALRWLAAAWTTDRRGGGARAGGRWAATAIVALSLLSGLVVIVADGFS